MTVQKLTLQTALLLAVPPLMWAGNAVVGRLVHTLIPPLTLNFFRWILDLRDPAAAGRLGSAAR